MANPEIIYGVLGSVAGILTIITGFIVKLHINRSKCGKGGFCFDCICDKDEIEAVQRVRSIKRSNNNSSTSLKEVMTEQPKEKTINIVETHV